MSPECHSARPQSRIVRAYNLLVGRTFEGQVHDLSSRALEVGRFQWTAYGTTIVSPGFNSIFCSDFFPLMTSL